MKRPRLKMHIISKHKLRIDMKKTHCVRMFSSLSVKCSGVVSSRFT